MKRITLGALDYGLAFGVDRALRELALNGRLSAIGALSASELWPREFKPLQETAEAVGNHVQFGVTLAFSGDGVQPVNARAQAMLNDRLPPREKVNRLAYFRLLPEGLLREEALSQLTRYSFLMDREPDFVAVRDGLLQRSSIAKLVMSAIQAAGFKKRPYIISPFETGLGARRLIKLAASHGLEVLPTGPELPGTIDREELHSILHRHFNGMKDRTFVAAIPAKADDRLRRGEPRRKVQIRECQYDVLASRKFFNTLEKHDVFLS